MMHQNTKFGNKMFVGLEGIIWTNTDILTLYCDLDLDYSNPIFHRTLWLMMLYYQAKFGCKPTSSLEDTTETDIFWLCPCCDLDIEHSEPIFLHDTLAYEAALQSQSW